MCVLSLDEALKRISEDLLTEGLSTEDFKITFVCPDTKGQFSLQIETPDDMSEEEVSRRFNEAGVLQIVIKKLCEFYPEAKEIDGGLRIPELKRRIYMETVLKKIHEC